MEITHEKATFDHGNDKVNFKDGVNHIWLHCYTSENKKYLRAMFETGKFEVTFEPPVTRWGNVRIEFCDENNNKVQLTAFSAGDITGLTKMFQNVSSKGGKNA